MVNLRIPFIFQIMKEVNTLEDSSSDTVNYLYITLTYLTYINLKNETFMHDTFLFYNKQTYRFDRTFPICC